MPQQDPQQKPKEESHFWRNTGLLAGGAALGGLGLRALTKGKFKGKMKKPVEASVISRRERPVAGLLPEYKGASLRVLLNQVAQGTKGTETMNAHVKNAYAYGVKVALDEVAPQQEAVEPDDGMEAMPDDPHSLRRALLTVGGSVGGTALGALLGHVGGARAARGYLQRNPVDGMNAGMMHDNFMIGGAGIGSGAGAVSGYGLARHLDNASPLGTDEQELAEIEGKGASLKQAYAYGAAAALQEAGVPYTKAIKVAFATAEDAEDAAAMHHMDAYHTLGQDFGDAAGILGGAVGGGLLGGLVGHGTGSLARKLMLSKPFPFGPRTVGDAMRNHMGDVLHNRHVAGGTGAGTVLGALAPLPYQVNKEMASEQAAMDEARAQWEAAQAAQAGGEKLSYDEEAMAELEASPEGRSILSRLLTGGAGAVGGATLGALLGHGAGKYVTGPAAGAMKYRGLEPGLQVPSMFNQAVRDATRQHEVFGAPIGAAAGGLTGGALGAAYDNDGYDPKVGQDKTALSPELVQRAVSGRLGSSVDDLLRSQNLGDIHKAHSFVASHPRAALAAGGHLPDARSVLVPKAQASSSAMRDMLQYPGGMSNARHLENALQSQREYDHALQGLYSPNSMKMGSDKTAYPADPEYTPEMQEQLDQPEEQHRGLLSRLGGAATGGLAGYTGGGLAGLGMAALAGRASGGKYRDLSPLLKNVLGNGAKNLANKGAIIGSLSGGLSGTSERGTISKLLGAGGGAFIGSALGRKYLGGAPGAGLMGGITGSMLGAAEF